MSNPMNALFQKRGSVARMQGEAQMNSSLSLARQASGKIRVLIVITRLTIGGDTNVVLDTADYFASHPEFEAHLAVGPVPTGEVDLTHLAFERSIPTIIIPELVNHVRPLTNLKALSDLRSLMVEGGYDIVHTHSSVAGVIGRMAAASARVPVIVHHVHGWGLQEGMSTPVRMLYLNLERFCAKFTNRLIAVSNPNIAKGLAYGIGPEEKYALIYNGIDLDKFREQIDEQQMRAELGLDADSQLVGMIGRLDQQKNPLDFIRAAAIVAKNYPQVQFLIAGEGILRSDCEKLIRQLALEDQFFLLGYRDDVDKILPILTLTALSSLWEGLPVVFVESMSAGKPIVANDVDGASDVIIDGETGYLVTPRQPEEMAERILTLLKDDELCRKMGENAQRRSERFSGRKMVREVEALYRNLAPTRPSATWPAELRTSI